MSINELLHILRRHMVLMIVLPLVGLVCAGGYSATRTPMYRATTSVYFSLPYGDSAVDLSQGSAYTQAQIESYSVLAKSPRVLESAASKLPFDATPAQLASAVQTTSVSGTVILQISATDASATHAALIADQTASSLRDIARDLSPKDAKGKPTVDVATIGQAKIPSVPSTPRTKRNLALGLLAGIVLAVTWALLREKVDTRIRSMEDLELGEIPSLGSMPLPRRRDHGHIAVLDAPTSSSAEQFRRLRTGLLFTQDGKDKSVALTVTSSCSGEGKSTLALNLASSFAEAGQRVLLVDADLRRPTIAERLDLEGAVGLSTVLSGQAPFEEVVQPMGGESGLDVLAAGTVPPNPAQLLGSARMQELMHTVNAIYDVVIVDSPPLLAVADAALVSPLTSGCVVVVRQGQTHLADIQDALSGLDNIDTHVLGLVLSRRLPRLRRSDPYTYESESRGAKRERRGVRHRARQERGYPLRRSSQRVGDFR